MSIRFDAKATQDEHEVNPFAYHKDDEEDEESESDLENQDDHIERYIKMMKTSGGQVKHILDDMGIKAYMPNAKSLGWFPDTDCVKNETATCDGGNGNCCVGGTRLRPCQHKRQVQRGFPRGQPVDKGKPSDRACWAYSFRWNLNHCKQKIMVQVVEDGQLGYGQKIEEAMAIKDGIKIVRIKLNKQKAEQLGKREIENEVKGQLEQQGISKEFDYLKELKLSKK